MMGSSSSSTCCYLFRLLTTKNLFLLMMLLLSCVSRNSRRILVQGWQQRRQHQHRLLSSSSILLSSSSTATASERIGARTTARYSRTRSNSSSSSTSMPLFGSSRIHQQLVSPTMTTTPSTTRCYQSTADATDSSDSSDSSDSGYFDIVSRDDTFESMNLIQSPMLLQRLTKILNINRPTSIQAMSIQAFQQQQQQQQNNDDNNIVIGAETGSGKTLAYLLPLMDDILCRKQKQKKKHAKLENGEEEGFVDKNDDDDDQQSYYYEYARAIILVPNKELVQQVVRMAIPLAGGGGGGAKSLVFGTSGGGGYTAEQDHVDDDDDDVEEDEIVRIAVMPGGLNDPMDFKPFRESVATTGSSSSTSNGSSPPPVDLVITTPAALAPLGIKPKCIDMFNDISTLVIDEADMLLDGGYIRNLEQVLLGFRRADKAQKRYAAADYNNNYNNDDDTDKVPTAATPTQHVFVAATLPDVGLRSVDAYLQRKFPYAQRITTSMMHNAKHCGLSENTQWIYEDNKKARMEYLVELLNTEPSPSPSSLSSSETSAVNNGLAGEKVMVFLNTVDDVDGACQAMNRAGIAALPYHAKLSLQERTSNLQRFRKYNAAAGPAAAAAEAADNNDNGNDDAIPVLVASDLASRGLDIPGVTAVVQLQFAGNVVSHLHRMGRCGRAGSGDDLSSSSGGRGIVFYGSQEQALVDVVQQAEREQDQKMVLKGNDVLEVELEIDDEDNNGDEGSEEKRRQQQQQQQQQEDVGKVKKAFSRKRGFTKKRKKLRREQQEQQQ